MKHRLATLDDVPVLAALNKQLAADEGHRNQSRPCVWFQERMRTFLSEEGYKAILFEDGDGVVAYALYLDDEKDSGRIYLRQFFVLRDRRRKGIGREAMRLLMDEIWPKGRRLTVEVLWQNTAAMAFWKAVGFREYSLELEICPVGDDRRQQTRGHGSDDDLA